MWRKLLYQNHTFFPILREVCLPFWFRLLFEKFLKNDQGLPNSVFPSTYACKHNEIDWFHLTFFFRWNASLFFFWKFLSSCAIHFFFSTNACTSMRLIEPTSVFSIERMKNHDITKTLFHLLNTLTLVRPKRLLDHHV